MKLVGHACVFAIHVSIVVNMCRPRICFCIHIPVAEATLTVAEATTAVAEATPRILSVYAAFIACSMHIYGSRFLHSVQRRIAAQCCDPKGSVLRRIAMSRIPPAVSLSMVDGQAAPPSELQPLIGEYVHHGELHGKPFYTAADMHQPPSHAHM